MTWSVRNRLALLAALLFLGGAAGCGDNTPKREGQGGSSGNNFEGGAGAGGGSGDAGLDADGSTADADASKPDADANQVTEAGGDATDSHPDSGETSGTGGADGGAGRDGGGGTDGGTAGAGGGTAGAGGGTAGAGGGTAGAGGGTAGAGGGTAGAGGGTAGAGGGTAGAGGGTAGAGTAGAGGGTAGNADGGTDTAPPVCYSVTFVNPVDQAQLSAADDKSGDQCVDGFQHDVVINTTAPDGTSVVLFAGSSMLGTVQAAAGKATFTGVQLPSSGTTTLSIQFPSTAPCSAASTTVRVTVDCSVPTCAVSKPTISGTHPFLNGVSTLQGGDRASGAGSPYEVGFEVTTNIADNQTVALDVDNQATPATVATVTAHAQGGKATFVGVPLVGDGKYEVQARCIDGNGVVGRSGKGTYPVDTLPPDLTVSKPSSGSFIGPGGLVNGAFQVCGKTTSGDAVGLDANLGTRQANFCVSTSGSPQCVPVTMAGADTCVPVTCPGDAPFSITVTLSDSAGNPQTAVLTGVTCSSAQPNVQIITPVTDAPTFTDPSRHLLAANAAQPFRDQTGALGGAQTDVTACSSRAGAASLFAGLHGGTLTQVGGSVATTVAAATDGCPTGFGFIAKFSGVTLPESLEKLAAGALDVTTGTLLTATQLRVDVTDVSSSTGTSAPLDLWVDSTPPAISLVSPVNLCGSFEQAFATASEDVTLATDAPNVTLKVVNGGSTDTLTSPNLGVGQVSYLAVQFNVGVNNVTAVATDTAGNTTALQPPSCTVTVGMAPTVFYKSPTSANKLCTATSAVTNCIDDLDGLNAGWQGSLTVNAILNGLPAPGNITFSIGGTVIGTAAINQTTGDATLAGVTLLDGTPTITASTDNIAAHGVGTAQLTIVVDLGPPDAPTNLTALVLDRRQTSVQLSWNAPGDQGAPVASYQVRYAKVPITAGNFDNLTVTTDVPFAGSPSPVGNPDGLAVKGLYIENGYYFAIASVDSAGNRSPIVATAAAVTAHFNVTVLPSTSGTNEELGYVLSANGDVDGDTISDIIVGAYTGGHAYLYLGSANFAPAAPTVVFSGASNGGQGFGSTVAMIGDIDGDNREDIAIADGVGNGAIYIYKGRAIWPPTLADSQADYVITGDMSYNGTLFGSSIAGLGNFTGDGAGDFAIGVPGYNGFKGRVVIVPGKTMGFAGFALAPTSANAIVIDADATLTTSAFGYRVLGLGHFYSVTSGTTLVVSAPGLAPAASANEGRLYAFHGQPGTGGAIAIGTADSLVVGPGKKAHIGQTLSNLGPMFGSLPAVGAGNEFDDLDILGTKGTGYVLSGDATTGPFANRIVVTQAGGINPGQAIFGGGLSGQDVSLSLIGDDTPDLVFASVSATTVDILDGAKLASKAPPVNSKTGEVGVTIPNTDSIAEGSGAIIKDINGDGVPDFALGFGYNVVAGKVRVFW